MNIKILNSMELKYESSVKENPSGKMEIIWHERTLIHKFLLIIHICGERDVAIN
jgi:hypothetical protein